MEMCSSRHQGQTSDKCSVNGYGCYVTLHGEKANQILQRAIQSLRLETKEDGMLSLSRKKNCVVNIRVYRACMLSRFVCSSACLDESQIYVFLGVLYGCNAIIILCC
jgi:hypothetical protein